MSAHLATEPGLLGGLLASRYEIRAIVGRGGMGDVFEAVDRQLDRTVAVKVLRADLAADPRFLPRFRREARTAARLAHPGIVAVHDIGEDAGRTFIVMEFVAGRTLAQILRDDGPLRPALAARIAADTAEALAHAHERGVVHRDVSPGNVMVTPSGTVKVLDFGIAHAARRPSGCGPLPPGWSSRGSSTRGSSSANRGSSSAHGTFAYVAPEQLRGDATDQRADVYAVGAVLHELLTGSPPADDRKDETPLHRAGGPQRAVIAIVRRCLSAEPAARYAQAGDLARSLRAAATSCEAWESAGDTQPLGARAVITASIRPRPERPGPVTPLAPTRRLSEPNVAGSARSQRGRSGRLLVVAASILALAGGAWVVVSGVASLSTPIRPRLHTPDPVSAPSGLAIHASCDGFMSTGADLSWTPGGRASAYEIWRANAPDGDYDVVARVGSDVTTYRDADLGVDTTYRYVVRAVLGRRTSAPTEEATAGTPLLCLS